MINDAHNPENFASFYYTPLAIHVVTLRRSLAVLEPRWTIEDENADKLRLLNAATSFYLMLNFDTALEMLASCINVVEGGSETFELDNGWGSVLTLQGIDVNFVQTFYVHCCDLLRMQMDLYNRYQEFYKQENGGNEDADIEPQGFAPIGWEPRLNFDPFVD